MSDFTSYPCSDYVASEWATTGLWDASVQLMVLVPVAEAVHHEDLGFLEIGRPGVDGILFGYRTGQPGIWAYYPIDDDSVLLAPDLQSFVAAWLNGQIFL